MHTDLTQKQINFLKYLEKEIAHLGRAHTLREAAADLKISHAAVARYIRVLEAKRFFMKKRHIELRPENPAYPVMKYPFSNVLIQGKVVGVQRGPGQFS